MQTASIMMKNEVRIHHIISGPRNVSSELLARTAYYDERYQQHSAVRGYMLAIFMISRSEKFPGLCEHMRSHINLKMPITYFAVYVRGANISAL